VTGAWPGPAFGAAVWFGGQRTVRIAGPAGNAPYPGSTGQGVRLQAAGGLLGCF